MHLVKYEAAVAALAECQSVDEVKSWADKAAALKAYARMSKNKELEINAAEIRLRAKRRMGELLAAQKAAGLMSAGSRGQLAGRNPGGSLALRNDEGQKSPTLADVGISYSASAEAQELAAVPPDEFEAGLAQWRERVEQEGQRVSSQLQASGRRRIREAQEGAAGVPDGVDDEAPSDEEVAYLQEKEREFNGRLLALLESSDAVAEAVQMARQAQALADALQFRINGLRNENAELIREVKRWRKRAEKAERAAAGGE